MQYGGINLLINLAVLRSQQSPKDSQDWEGSNDPVVCVCGIQFSAFERSRAVDLCFIQEVYRT